MEQHNSESIKPTLRAVMAFRTGDGVIHNNHPQAVVAVIPSRAHCARRLSHLILVESPGAQYRGSCALRAEMANNTLISCGCNFSLWTVVAGRAVSRSCCEIVAAAVFASCAVQTVWCLREKQRKLGCDQLHSNTLCFILVYNVWRMLHLIFTHCLDTTPSLFGHCH